MNKRKFFEAIASCLMILLLLAGCTDNKREPQPVPQDNGNKQQDAGSENVFHFDNKIENLSGWDVVIKKLFDDKQSGVQVRGSGIVTQLLADDNDGARHQRFILKLGSGQTLLIAHNIDIAPRLHDVSLGTKVEFYGEYFYNDQGGGIHWTHHDPNGRHVSGYLKILSQPFPVRHPATESKNYIGNKNSQVFHVPTCDRLPYEKNRVFFESIDEAMKHGYRKHYECMGN